MGLFSKVLGRARSARHAIAVAPVPPARRGFRRLHIEQMEERRMMTASPITIGAVYFDPGTGFDQTPNTFRISFNGGAAGTELTTLTINTDKDNDGLGPADTFFDTAAGGLGVYGFHPFAQVDNGEGIIINSVSVVDGGTLLTLNLSGFTAGKTLVFTIDVDEMGARNFANAVAEGAEFQFSDLTATFTAPHYFNATGSAEFFDAFDPAFAGSGLNLPNDDYSPVSDSADPVLTAGAIFNLVQPPKPSSLSGYVFDDTNIDNLQEPGELGIGGVSLTLKIWNGSAYVDLPTVTTTVTAADGSYKFDNLAPGKYRVVETQPSGYFSVGARAGNISGVTDGVVTTVDIISDVVLDPDQKSVHNDFAEARPAQISGYVYSDLNNNGVKDPGELGIAGATVHLLDAGLNEIGSMATDSNGHYAFTNLFPGAFTLIEDQPGGYLDGKDAVGTGGGGILAPPDGLTNIVLLSGANGVHYDFGELLPGKITGMVHADRNGDCVYQQGEPLLANVTIQLLNSQGQVIQTTKTDANGNYEFDQLPPGTYTVHEVQPAGYFEGGNMLGTASGVVVDIDTLGSIVMTPGLQALHYNFCEEEPASIAGMVHADRNGDCMYQEGEPLLSGVTIQLISNGQVVATTLTDSMGQYKFSNLAPGTYTVHEVQPAGYFEGGDTLGSVGGAIIDVDTMTATLGAHVDAVEYNFCEQEPASIAGMVHADRNGDCLFQEGEPLLSGVTIQLISNGHVVATTLTDSMGQYKFSNLAPGTYTVHEVQPAGYFEGGDSLGSVGGAINDVDTMTTTLGAHVDAVEYNFCEEEPGSIAGMVHVDSNGDCIYEPGEQLLAGVTVQLINSQGQVIATTVTDNMGEYKFSNLPKGTYTVHELLPPGYFLAGDSVGSVGGVIVDLATLGSIGLAPAVNATDYDFCVHLPGSIAGMIHVDTNGDCVYQPGEPLLAGVTVQLIDSNGQVIATTLTDNMGQYKFDNLAPGTYTVHEIQPPGYTQGGDSVGSVGGVIVDVDTLGSIEIGAGVTAVNYDFCEQGPVCLSGLVFVDPNHNGKLDGGEFPIAGVVIQLLDANGNVVATTTTNSDGYYQFCGIAAGTYGVHEIQPQGFLDDADYVGTQGGLLDNDLITQITLPPGVQATQYNFTEINPPFIPPDKPGTFVPLIPMATPPVPVYLVWITPTPAPYVPLSLYYGGGYVLGYTWHLSVIDAGRPRSDQLADGRVATISTGNDPFQQSEGDVHESQWLLGMPGQDEDGNENSRVVRFGMRNGIPVTGDFNGDGVSDVGFYYNGHWYIDLNGNSRWDASDLWAKLGNDGDKPVTGDWDGDGKTDIGIFGRAWPGDPYAIKQEPGLPAPHNLRTGKQKNVPPVTQQAALGYRTMKHTAQGDYRKDVIDHVFHYGTPGDIPITGDWHGTGIHTIGLFHKGNWILDTDADGRWTDGDTRFVYGQDGDIPVVGDFNGDGLDELGVYRNGVWYIDTNNDRVLDAHDRVFQLGGAGDTPVVGDWNGDGVDEPGVYQQGPKAVADSTK